MKLRPGRSLGWFGGAGVLICIGSFVWSPLAWGIAVLGVATAALLIIENFQGRKELLQLAVHRNLPGKVGRDATFEDHLTIVNRAGRAVVLQVRDELPAGTEPGVWQECIRLENGQTRVISRELRINRRGQYSFGPIWIRLQGRLGLLEFQGQHDKRDNVKVLPEVLIEKASLSHKQGEQLQLSKLVKTHLQGAGTEFATLNEFREGDEPRRIDWRASARGDHLIVRRYEIEQHRDVLTLIDCGRLMGADIGGTTKLDQAINATLMLCRVALSKGDRFGLGLFDASVRGYLPPQGEKSAFHRIREAIADVPARMLETDFAEMFSLVQKRQRKRALLIVLSDMLDTETTGRFRLALASLRKRHVMLFVALQTPQFQELLQMPIEETRDAAREAVIFRLLREREKALHSMKRSGVHILDVEPRELTVPLIQQYIDLREQNLL